MTDPLSSPIGPTQLFVGTSNTPTQLLEGLNNNLSSHDYLAELDNIANDLTKEWKGSIRVEVDRNGLGVMEEIDICQEIGKYKNEFTDILYFNREDFPPPSTNETINWKTDPSWNKLKLYIIRQAHDCGSPVISNGMNGNDRKFVCFCHRMYKPAPNKKQGPFRQDHLVGSDKKGRRANGRKASRRCSTKRAIDKNNICKFKFQISLDSKGFLLNQVSGTVYHTSHPKVDPASVPIPTRLIPEDERKNLIALADSCVGAGVGRNFLHSKLGKYVTRAKIAYVQENHNVTFSGKSVPRNDVDELLKFFHDSTEISHQVLWDVPINSHIELLSQTPTFNENISSTQKQRSAASTSSSDSEDSSTNNSYRTPQPNTNNKSHQKLVSTCFNREVGNDPFYIDHSNEPGMDVLIEEARCARSAKNVSENAKVFLCVAWSSVEEIRLFKCFPEVIYCDATADTNNTKNQLVTFTGRTTSGRQFIFLRIWIHNQRKSTFQWIFKVVLRTFIPNRFFQQVRVCLVDGDPQQHFNLIQALKTYLHNAVHSTCAYHLVSSSWKRHSLLPFF